MQFANAAFDFIDSLDQTADAPSLVETFQALIRKLGMTYFMVGNPSQPGVTRDDRLIATTWPQEWLEHWSSQRYLFVDPIVKQLLSSREPVRWSPTERAADRAGTRILEEASEHRMPAGFAVPVYNREGLVVAVSMATEHYELGRRDEYCLHLASIYFHSKLEALRTPSAPPPRGPRLTPRERECLSWVASGKTDWEISQILTIAEQTVHEYVQNALIKLNATTRAQAVAIAIITKQILN
jgi:DNA-binding CsgD family transcriptional regulator